MIKGIVTKSTGSWYRVKTEEGRELNCRIKGKFRLDGMKLTNPVAVGDEVMLVLEDDKKAIGIIQKILPRKNYVVRQSPRKKHHLHLLASNIDQAILIVTIVNPKLKQGFIDRFLLMVEPYNIPTTLVFNKADLYDEEDLQIFAYFKAVYQDLDYKVLLTSALQGEGIDTLKAILKDKISLVSGQSGVGKSTLINAITPQLELRTQHLSDYSGKGQHTTTFAEMFPLEFGGSIIDTPGIKTLSFNNLQPLDVAHNFREFFEYSENCKFANCLHRNEPKCAVKAAIEAHEISEFRYGNYLHILNDIEEQNYWETLKM